jgi:hypothetical protein
LIALSRIDRTLTPGAIRFSARFCCASGRGVARVGGQRKLGNPGRLNYVAGPGGNAGVRWHHDLFAYNRLFAHNRLSAHNRVSAHNRSRIMYFGGSFGDCKF